jgi:hypothetical protein
VGVSIWCDWVVMVVVVMMTMMMTPGERAEHGCCTVVRAKNLPHSQSFVFGSLKHKTFGMWAFLGSCSPVVWIQKRICTKGDRGIIYFLLYFWDFRHRLINGDFEVHRLWCIILSLKHLSSVKAVFMSCWKYSDSISLSEREYVKNCKKIFLMYVSGETVFTKNIQPVISCSTNCVTCLY